MSISEIISLICIALKKEYPEITVYKEKIKQGFKTPCFFVTCLDSEQNKIGRNRYSREYLFNIRFHIDDSKRIDLLQKGEELEVLLQELKKEEVVIYSRNFKFEIVDNVLQFFCSYKQTFIKDNKKEAAMNILDITEKINKEVN